MKVIDLLNKIANGIDIPLQIKYDNDIWKYDEMARDYLLIDKSGEEYLICEELNLMYALNEEVEVVEEEQEDKKIRKIKTEYSPDIEEEIFYVDGNKPNHCILGDNGTKLIINKINEIIDKINKD